MNKLALVALAGAFALSPLVATADTDNGPAQPGGQNETVQYGQGVYLHAHSTISMTVPQYCTSLSADDVTFNDPTTGATGAAPNHSASVPLFVRWNCVTNVFPIVAFESTANKCHLVSPGPSNAASLAGIPYHIYSDDQHTGTDYCNPDASSPPSKYYTTFVPHDVGGHVFDVQTDTLVSNNGYALFPAGTYKDTVDIYLSF